MFYLKHHEISGLEIPQKRGLELMKFLLQTKTSRSLTYCTQIFFVKVKSSFPLKSVKHWKS